MERIWGGNRLQTLLHKPIPSETNVGEAWLISDHPCCVSIAREGPWAGKTLNELIAAYPGYMLGSVANATPSGRFPLLLKIIDAGETLSVQVHPDDRQAAALGEADPGKTEMWHVLKADPNAELTLGFSIPCDQESIREAVSEGTLERFLNRFPVKEGESIFVDAGTVHAIGAGILLAEIQQNSDITYRLYDWNRRDAEGNPRTLHLEKALAVLRYSPVRAAPKCPNIPMGDGGFREILSACRYFAAERITVSRDARLALSGSSFHILLALSENVTLRSGGDVCRLRRGEAALLPAMAGEYIVAGPASMLRYYVPDLSRDIIDPLRMQGMEQREILAFCGQAQPQALQGRCQEASDLTGAFHYM